MNEKKIAKIVYPLHTVIHSQNKPCKRCEDTIDAILALIEQELKEESRKSYQKGWDEGKRRGRLETEQEQKPMVEALKEAQTELQIWLIANECDCPGEGHICGRPRVYRTLAKIDAVLPKGEGK